MAAPPRLRADVVVLGAGPAGATLALNLAPFRRVLLLDKGAAPGARIGESLPAAAGRLLRDMGLQRAFLQQGHAPCQASRASWGGDDVLEQDAMRNLDGHGWHLDREHFDAWLLAVAQRRGAALLPQSRPVALARAQQDGAPWLLQIERAGKPLQVEAGFLVDASGRSGWIAKQLGGQRLASDKLVCGWLFGQEAHGGAGISELHAEADGWWYSSPLPGNGRVLAFYTDADLPAARDAHSGTGLLARLGGVPALRRLVEAHAFQADGRHGFCAAHGSALEQATGTGWLAVGDAALSFDPLSAQGLFNALYTGLAGAEAVQRDWEGEHAALPAYQRELKRIHNAYRTHLDAWYGQEKRWTDRAFWQRRQAAAFSRT